MPSCVWPCFLFCSRLSVGRLAHGLCSDAPTRPTRNLSKLYSWQSHQVRFPGTFATPAYHFSFCPFSHVRIFMTHTHKKKNAGSNATNTSRPNLNVPHTKTAKQESLIRLLRVQAISGAQTKTLDKRILRATANVCRIARSATPVGAIKRQKKSYKRGLSL